MLASISCSERARRLLDRIRSGEEPDPAEVRSLGGGCAGEFFRIVVEALADSFDPAQAAIYEKLMRVWIPRAHRAEPQIPDPVDTVYVLSRVTLGADIKIVSPMLMAMRRRFPQARVVFVANRKSIELFENERGLDFLEADYPRGGSIEDRIEFAHRLREQLHTPNRIVIDPDSRMTQLGLIPVCEPASCFHFPSRTAGGYGSANLRDLVREWLHSNFGITGPAFLDPKRVHAAASRPFATISLGVGENENKRLGLEFERRVIAEIARRFRTLYVDRGAGGAEAARVTEAAAACGSIDLRFWEGSFAGFASIISQSDFYFGYDSAGQHAAAASGIPLVAIFAGAPSERFRQRWSPQGPGDAHVIDAGGRSPEEVLARVLTVLPGQ